MTDIIDRPQMPEEKLPDLEPVYAELGEDYAAMDVLDAVVFARPNPITRAEIAAHCCAELPRERAAREIAARMRRLDTVLRRHDLRLRSIRVAGRGNFNRRYGYRLTELCIAGLVVFSVAMPLDAAAQPNCKTRDEIVTALAAQYQESRRAYGLSRQMQMLELFAAENGTWTAVMSQPNGTSCIVASGTDWTELAPPEPGRPL